MAIETDLVRRAVEVLRGNDVGGYTKPSPRLYPHQWNWDSAFVAIGLAHVDWARAAREIEGVLAGRWIDGMLPHIRYNREVTSYSPGPEWWPDVPVADPTQVTSGISQPPIMSSAAYEVGLRQPDERLRTAWWGTIYEPLREALLYFSRSRTVEANPLIVVVHPWESALDNSPRWDFATGRGFAPSRPYHRTDTTVVDSAARPTGRDYDLYLYLVELIASRRYRLAEYLPATPFAVYDALFNALWYRSCADLNRVAAALGRPPAVEPAALQAFRDAYHATLWDADAALFRDHDLKQHRQIPVDTIAGLAAIYAGLVDAGQARSMLQGYGARSEGCLPLPSTLPDQEGFDPVKYWRGPVWVNTNWMVLRGLQSLGLPDEAAALRGQTLRLIEDSGFFEYFHAHSGAGLGGSDFSWSAALAIDLLRRP